MEKEKITIEAALVENERRHARLAADLYDPLTGVGCWGDRVDVGGVLVPGSCCRLVRSMRAWSRWSRSAGAFGRILSFGVPVA